MEPSLDVIMSHMVTPLRLRPFSASLCKKLTTNLDELWQQVAKFMQLKELKDFQNQMRDEATTGKKHLDKGVPCLAQ